MNLKILITFRISVVQICALENSAYLTSNYRVFPRPFTHGGDLSIWGGTSAGGQSVNGGTHEGGHRPYGGDLTLIDYIIN